MQSLDYSQRAVIDTDFFERDRYLMDDSIVNFDGLDRVTLRLKRKREERVGERLRDWTKSKLSLISAYIKSGEN